MDSYYIILISHKKNQDEKFCFFEKFNSGYDLEFIKTFYINIFNNKKIIDYINFENVKRISKEDFEKYKKYDFGAALDLIDYAFKRNKKRMKEQKIQNLKNKVKIPFVNIFKSFIS